jgi:membrane protein YqaA with SNARE-associated domain
MKPEKPQGLLQQMLSESMAGHGFLWVCLSLALFVIALSPLPQTPALVFAGIVRHDYADVFAVMLAGKFFKYGAYAWLTASFPERFSNGIGGFFHLRR